VSMAVDSSIPSDQAMLLRVIDAKFETSNAKLDGISATLTVMNDRFSHYDKRFENVEHTVADHAAKLAARDLQVIDFVDQKKLIAVNTSAIIALEKWQTEEQTTTRNASKWGGAVWTLVGSAVTAILGWLIVSYVNATATPTVQVQPPQTVHQVESGTSTTTIAPTR
jgi:hypothetical protein